MIEPEHLEDGQVRFPPLDAARVFATLMVVVESPGLTIENASEAVGITPEWMIHEAEAWAVPPVTQPDIPPGFADSFEDPKPGTEYLPPVGD